MKNKEAMMAMMFAMIAEPQTNYLPERPTRELKEPKPPKGCQRFFINGQEIWAINEKNAQKKAAKLAEI